MLFFTPNTTQWHQKTGIDGLKIPLSFSPRPRSWLLISLFFFAMACALNVLAASSQNTLTAKDEKAARDLVAAQLAAFAADDSIKAFSFASSSIQKRFQSPDNFMNMVRAHYPVVYRPATVAYLKPEKDGDAVIMKVEMTDAAGKSWMAIYSLQRPSAKEKNKTWRIAGCVVASKEDRTVEMNPGGYKPAGFA